MKARVSYTMDIKEVPGLIKKLLSECQESLNAEGYNLKVDLHDVEETVSKIKSTRNSLSMIDSKLEDISNLILGWHQALQSTDLDEEEQLAEADER